MKRRNLLTAAGAMAGVSLAGCGGGGDEAESEIASEIGSDMEEIGSDLGETELDPIFDPLAVPDGMNVVAPVPAYLVPANGHYQIEVSFRTTRQMVVYMRHESKWVTLAWKPVTTGSSHKLGYAVWRTGLYYGLDRRNFYLLVRESSDLDVYAGNGTTLAEWKRYVHKTDGGVDEYEWSFYSRKDRMPTVTVRFFPLPADELVRDFGAGEYVRPILNTAVDANKTPLHVVHFPKSLTTSSRHLSHEAAVIPSTLRDTICLPSGTATANHDELVPCYLGASKSEKPLLKRRMLRHIHRFAKTARDGGHQLDSTDDFNSSHMIGNEILRLLGGKSLIDHAVSTRSGVMNSIRDNFEQMSPGFQTFCTNWLPTLSSDEMVAGARTLRDQAAKPNGKAAGGLGVSVLLQASVATGETAIWPGVSGYGGRISLGLCRASKNWAAGGASTSNEYTIKNIRDYGTKLGFTIILKGFGGQQLKIVGYNIADNFTVDTELTCNFTILNNVWRIDLMQFDIVVDVDTRAFLGKLANKAFAHLMSPYVGGTEAVAALPAALSFAPPGWLSVGAAEADFCRAFAQNTAQVVADGVKAVIKPLVAKAADEFSTNVRFTWGVQEWSPLRFVMPNADLGNGAPFAGGFRYAGTGWQPGCKYIAGIGFGGKYTVPYFPPGLPVPVGTPYIDGYVRNVVLTDAYALFGSADFIKAMGYPWEY